MSPQINPALFTYRPFILEASVTPPPPSSSFFGCFVFFFFFFSALAPTLMVCLLPVRLTTRSSASASSSFFNVKRNDGRFRQSAEGKKAEIAANGSGFSSSRILEIYKLLMWQCVWKEDFSFSAVHIRPCIFILIHLVPLFGTTVVQNGTKKSSNTVSVS